MTNLTKQAQELLELVGKADDGRGWYLQDEMNGFVEILEQDRHFIAACSPQNLTPLLERLIELEKDILRFGALPYGFIQQEH